MKRGRGLRPAVLKALFVFAVGIIVAFSARMTVHVDAGPAPSREVRIVPVTLVADSRLGSNEVWKVDLSRVISEVNRVMREKISVRLRARAYDYCDTEATRAGKTDSGRACLRSLLSYLPAFRNCPALRDKTEEGILIGLVPEDPDGPVNLGIADYLNGIIVIKYLKAKDGMPYVLLHEVCHLFGAIDLNEPGSVMSLENPTFRLDGFTESIMRVNRDRSFRRGGFPLSWDQAAAAIALYGEREALGFGESQLRICINELQVMIAARR